MGVVGVRVWWFLFFAMAIASTVTVSAARNTISLAPPGKGKEEVIVVAMEMEMEMGHDQLHNHGGVVVEGGEGRRSLKISLNDYSEPSANHGHDPKNRGGGGHSKGRDTNDTTP